MHRHCRRSFLAGLAAVAAFSRARAASSGERLDLANKHLASIEAREGGRLGVFVRDTGTGATLERRADERFPMCSTFKLLASAAVLKRVDQGAERLDRTIAYGPSDLLEYAPIAKTHVAQGGMTLAEALRRRDRLERQHRGEPDPAGDRRASRVHAIRALARRQCDAARPQRAKFEHRNPRRRARHHESARHGRGHATSPDRRRAFRSLPASANGVADRRQGRRQAVARRLAALMAHRRQDRQRGPWNDEHDRDHLAAGASPNRRCGLLHRILGADGRAQRSP